MFALHPLLVIGLTAIVLMAILWVIHWLRTDAGFVDFGWTAGLGIAAGILALSHQSPGPRVWLVACLAGVWAFRLAGYVLVNRLIGKPEDGRYQSLRRQFGPRAPLYFFLFFESQALLVVLFAVPYWVAMNNPLPWPTFWDVAGIAVWIVAAGGEMLADWQLARFRADPANKGKVCQHGLWRYSRHPNYFFEWLHWWTYVLLAIGGPWWPLALMGPAAMLLFLLFITGIPATEAQAVASRGEANRRYQRTTSPFIPWFPRTLSRSDDA